MVGLLLSQREVKEIEYMIKRELEEILMDLGDERIDILVKKSMVERYKELFSLFKRIASPKDCLNYILKDDKYLDEKI
ncbi:hypothetical protein [Niallia taxi]|uniref:Uncharacterized protein n=1 Tax=Niallia taxi TaxID=2499688 RepID=A0A437K3M4_9BACI|nr:hypothetical protein [Niallia taxi]MCM3217946.1 hypothetical protein [Niallia taxi]MCT2346536.1 hypothetical protein [Niallia taxi]MDE5055887.1 hypothetical protein [Niallia taxi]MDK8643088.1 hypothetical protein [Niallia taxi]MED3965865.1 hypothetical protein [Niallia taxi]